MPSGGLVVLRTRRKWAGPTRNDLSQASCCLSLGGSSSLPLGDRSPLPALAFHVMSVSNALCVSLQITTPTRFCVGPGCSACVRGGCSVCCPSNEPNIHNFLFSAAASLTVHPQSVHNLYKVCSLSVQTKSGKYRLFVQTLFVQIVFVQTV